MLGFREDFTDEGDTVVDDAVTQALATSAVGDRSEEGSGNHLLHGCLLGRLNQSGVNQNSASSISIKLGRPARAVRISDAVSGSSFAK